MSYLLNNVLFSVVLLWQLFVCSCQYNNGYEFEYGNENGFGSGYGNGYGYQYGMSQSPAPMVKTRRGRIYGSISYTRSGRQVDGFRGISYAEPPVGPLRFRDPVRVALPEGDFYATEDGPICVQPSPRLDNNTINGVEDCLRINVYRPHDASSEKLAVLVYIVGGKWTLGSDDIQVNGPEYLLDQSDILFVVFNIRLGVFGFFSLADEVVPGNFGLKDTVAALAWVNENIIYFGGDPNRVTIVGASSGSITVDSLFYSQLARGYFQQGVSLSGTANSPLSHQPLERAVSLAKRFASVLGCPTTDSTGILECMQTKPAYELVSAQRALTPEGFPQGLITFWLPVYDYTFSKYPFFPDDINITYYCPTYPWINGVAHLEGTGVVTEMYTFPEFVKRLMADPYRYLPELLSLPLYLSDREQIANVTRDIVNFYFGYPPVVTQEQLINLFTDSETFIPSLRSTFRHCGLVWYYGYEYILPETWNYVNGPPGAVPERPGNLDVLLLLYETPKFFRRRDNATDISVSQRFVKLITSFVRTGNPTAEALGVTWDTYGSADRFNFLYVDKEFVQMLNPEPPRHAFWEYLQWAYPDLY